MSVPEDVRRHEDAPPAGLDIKAGMERLDSERA